MRMPVKYDNIYSEVSERLQGESRNIKTEVGNALLKGINVREAILQLTRARKLELIAHQLLELTEDTLT